MIKAEDKSYPSEFVIDTLDEFVSVNRKARIDQVLLNRTNSLVTVIEGLHNSGNISAVMRSAEGMGFHEFHIIENGEYFKKSSRTSQGADKWLDCLRWKDTLGCFEHLKSKGYQIVVTELGAETSIEEVDFTKKTALVFGNEARGVSDDAKNMADVRCMLPMDGFVESYNISVAAALCLQHAAYFRKNALGRNGDLSDRDREELKALYYYQSVRSADRILERVGSTD